MDRLHLEPARRLDRRREKRPRARKFVLGRRTRHRLKRSALRSSSLSVTHRARSLKTRFDISDAAAFVYVRQRIFCGATPDNRSRNTRIFRTCVLPVPAFALTHTDAAGSEACNCTRPCASVRRQTSTRRAFMSRSPPSCRLRWTTTPQPAPDGQTRRSHRRSPAAATGRYGVCGSSNRVMCVLRPSSVSAASAAMSGQSMSISCPGGSPPGRPDVAQATDRPRRHVRKSAFERDRSLQRQLRRKPAVDLLRIGRRARFVVRDDEALRSDVDPVCARGERERPARRLEHELSARLRNDESDIPAPLGFRLREPLRKAHEARQPERRDTRMRAILVENLPAPSEPRSVEYRSVKLPDAPWRNSKAPRE